MVSFEDFTYKKKPSVLVIPSDNEDGIPSDEEAAVVQKRKKPVAIVSDDSDDDNDGFVPQHTKRKRIVVIESDDEVQVTGEIKSPLKSPTSATLDSTLETTQEDFDDAYDVLNFVNTSPAEHLCCVRGLSENKAQRVKSLSPFNDYDEMVEKLNAAKLMVSGTEMIPNIRDLLNERARFQSLVEFCEQVAEKTNQAVSTLGDDYSNLPIKQPACMNSEFSLKGYQLFGLNWLAMLQENELNGILADQMGLGKTIQTLAFIGHLLENGCQGTYVVICPCSTLDNWVREFEKWLPEVDFTQYSGSQEERQELRMDLKGRMSGQLIIITTFNHALGNKKDQAFFRNLSIKYLILDEAHMIKNVNTARFKQLSKLNVKRKLLLTGTPLQNNVVELISLLSFLMPKRFEEFSGSFQKEKLEFLVSSAVKEKEAHYLTKVKTILKPFVLRRLKADVLNDMPSKINETITCELTTEQKKLYTNYFGEVGTDPKMHMSKIMNLRKISNHPLLIRSKYTNTTLEKMATDYCNCPFHMDSNRDLVLEDMKVMSDFELHQLCCKENYLKSHKLSEQDICNSAKLKVLDKLLPKLKQVGDRVLIFSQFVIVLDILQAYLNIRNIRCTRLDGSTKGNERLDLIDEFTNDNEIFVFLLSTRAGGLGINLTSANTVILHDIDYNPYNDKQAEDRCHRMGQTRQVTIYKLIGKDTIEENILQNGEIKLQLEKDLVNNTDTISDTVSTNMSVKMLKDNYQKLKNMQS